MWAHPRRPENYPAELARPGAKTAADAKSRVAFAKPKGSKEPRGEEQTMGDGVRSDRQLLINHVRLTHGDMVSAVAAYLQAESGSAYTAPWIPARMIIAACRNPFDPEEVLAAADQWLAEQRASPSVENDTDTTATAPGENVDL